MSLGLEQSTLFEGYGEDSLEQTAEIVKALEAQEGVTDIANLQGGGALQPQSLETTLAMLTFQDRHLKLFKDLGIVKAYSTLEEYSVQDGYGSEGGFVGQLENPDEGDPDFRREFAQVKYIRALWRTASVLKYTRTIQDADVKNTQAAMLRVLRTVEKTLFFGDSSVVPQGWDGLRKTIETRATTDHVIDLRGGNLSETLFKQASELISVNYGYPTDMYLSPGAQTGVDSILFDAGAQRYNQEVVSSGSGLIALGHSVTQMRTSFGNFNFKSDIFIAPESQGVPKIKDPGNPGSLIEGATAPKAPATPSFALAVDAPSVANSQWKVAGDGGAIAGVYNYRIVGINQYGKSTAAAQQSATVAADGAISITITPGGGATPETGYEIYRETAPGSGKIRFLKSISKTAGPTTVFQDLNADLAGTSVSFLLDNTTLGEDRTIALSQLAPIHKVQYAPIAPYSWGTVNFYAVPKYYAPLRFVMFKNIGIGKETRSQIIDL